MANREQLQLIRAARAGEGSAQLALGRHYLFGGKGLPQNFATALHWLDRAARQNIDDAWLLIGSHVPFEVAQRANNMAQLLDWYERAYDAGTMQAGLVFAQLVQAQGDRLRDRTLRDKARLALQAAARAGIAEAQWLLAQSQEDQSQQATARLPKNVPEASLEWAAAAAEAGIVAARFALAEHAWAVADYKAFLCWSLPLARNLVRRPLAASS